MLGARICGVSDFARSGLHWNGAATSLPFLFNVCFHHFVRHFASSDRTGLDISLSLEVPAEIAAACKRLSYLSAGTILGTPWKRCGRDWRDVWRHPASRSDGAAPQQRRVSASCGYAARMKQYEGSSLTSNVYPEEGRRKRGTNLCAAQPDRGATPSSGRDCARRPTPAAAVQGVCPTSYAAHCGAASASKRLARPGSESEHCQTHEKPRCGPSDG